MNVRPYVIYGESQLTELGDHIERAFRRWINEWFVLPRNDVRVMVRDNGYLDYLCAQSGQNVVQFSSSDCWCAIANSVSDFNELASSLLGNEMPLTHEHDGSDFVIEGVLAGAIEDLFKLVTDGLSSNQDAFMMDVSRNVPKEVSEKGSGCVAVLLSLNDVSLNLLCSAELVRQLLADTDFEPAPSNSRDLISLSQALSRRRVVGSVRLGTAELTIEDLLSIQEGDVLSLEEKLNSPAILSFGGKNAFKVLLGKKGDKVAVRILTGA